MLQEMQVWSPEQELQLLEELAEVEAQAFEMEMEIPLPSAAMDAERPWVAFWRLPPPDGIPPKSRTQPRLARER